MGWIYHPKLFLKVYLRLLKDDNTLREKKKEVAFIDIREIFSNLNESKGVVLMV